MILVRLRPPVVQLDGALELGARVALGARDLDQDRAGQGELAGLGEAELAAKRQQVIGVLPLTRLAGLADRPPRGLGVTMAGDRPAVLEADVRRVRPAG